MYLKIGLFIMTMSGVLWGQRGAVTTLDVPSETLGRSWKTRVYLPPGYDASSVHYPVVYLLHGSGGDEHGWDVIYPVLDSLIGAGAIPPAIAIAPASGTSWWVNGREPFESAFVDDLIPVIDRRYRTIDHRDGRCIAGYSMGGYGALRYALAHSDIFAAATLLSPALYHDAPPPESSARTSGAFGEPFDPTVWTARNYPAALKTYLDREYRVPVFIFVGDDDWNHPEGFAFNIEQQAVLLYGYFHRQIGSPAELRIVNGGHNWRLWKPGFIEGIQYMLRFKNSSGEAK